MILLSRDHLKEIADAAEAAYPAECCGLLVGRTRPNGDIEVARVVASRNLAGEGAGDRFEVDPQVRIDLQRELEGRRERIVGLFHSHPDHPARPSPRDLENALEPELVWLITSVVDGRAVHTTAHVLDPEARRFREIELGTRDRAPGRGRGASPRR